MIFNKDQEKCCSVCEKARPIVNSHAIICRKKGIVDCDYVCGHFKYDPLKRVPARKKNIIADFKKEDFSID